jgi:hypothetical protein
MTLEQVDLLAGWASLILTLMVFSYLLADNFLYRIAVHLLVGAAAVYVAITAIEQVVVPWINLTLVEPEPTAENIGVRLLGTIPIALTIFLFLKGIKRYAPLGNIGTALLIGVGSAVALVGVTLSTLFPTIDAAGQSINGESAINALILLAGTICTLIYFQYLSIRKHDGTPQRPFAFRLPALVGQGFIAVTLGALYAGAILTSLTIFSSVINDQIRFILDQL